MLTGLMNEWFVVVCRVHGGPEAALL